MLTKCSKLYLVKEKGKKVTDIQWTVNLFDGEQSDEMNHFYATKDTTIKLFDRVEDP